MPTNSKLAPKKNKVNFTELEEIDMLSKALSKKQQSPDNREAGTLDAQAVGVQTESEKKQINNPKVLSRSSKSTAKKPSLPSTQEDELNISSSKINDIFGNMQVKKKGGDLCVYLSAEVLAAIEHIHNQRGIKKSTIVDLALKQVFFG